MWFVFFSIHNITWKCEFVGFSVQSSSICSFFFFKKSISFFFSVLLSHIMNMRLAAPLTLLDISAEQIVNVTMYVLCCTVSSWYRSLFVDWKEATLLQSKAYVIFYVIFYCFARAVVAICYAEIMPSSLIAKSFFEFDLIATSKVQYWIEIRNEKSIRNQYYYGRKRMSSIENTHGNLIQSKHLSYQRCASWTRELFAKNSILICSIFRQLRFSSINRGTTEISQMFCHFINEQMSANIFWAVDVRNKVISIFIASSIFHLWIIYVFS